MKIYYAAALIMAFALAIVAVQNRRDLTSLSVAEPTPPREILPPFFVRLPWSIRGAWSEPVTPLDLQFEIIRPQPSVSERRRAGALGELWQRSVFAAETPIVHQGRLLDLEGLRAQIRKYRRATTPKKGESPELGTLLIRSDYEQAFDWVLIILAECRAQDLSFRELRFGTQERYWPRSVQVLGQFYGWDQMNLLLPSSAP